MALQPRTDNVASVSGLWRDDQCSEFQILDSEQARAVQTEQAAPSHDAADNRNGRRHIAVHDATNGLAAGAAS